MKAAVALALAAAASAPASASTPARSADPLDFVPPPATPLFSTALRLGDYEGWSFTPGGHAKTLFESYRNQSFGLAPVPDDTWLHQRIQAALSLDWRDRFRWFTEFTWGDITGKDGPLAPPDRDDPDLLQLYLQGRLTAGTEDELVLRAGRQILHYGSGRLLAHREGANQRLAHDALRLSWRTPAARWRVDALAASPVAVEPYAFDNSSAPDERLLWGVYAVGPSVRPGEGRGTDLYYLGVRLEDSLLAGRGNTELRHTFGTRWWGRAAPWLWNTEVIFQLGEAADDDIVAGALSLGGGRVFDLGGLDVTAGFKGDVISGGEPSSGHTFNPLFQANNYFNEGGTVSPANLYNLNPYVTLEPLPRLSLTGGVNFLWRFDAEDFVYGPPFARVAPPAPGGETWLGTALNFSAGWTPHPSVTLAAGYTHHFVGDSLTAVGGRDVDYVQTSLRIEF